MLVAFQCIKWQRKDFKNKSYLISNFKFQLKEQYCKNDFLLMYCIFISYYHIFLMIWLK